MNKVLPTLEHHSQALLPVEQFASRMFASVGIAMVLIVLSLLFGMFGYHQLEHLGWLDSFLNASMLLGAMAPIAHRILHRFHIDERDR